MIRLMISDPFKILVEPEISKIFFNPFENKMWRLDEFTAKIGILVPDIRHSFPRHNLFSIL